MLSFIGKLTTKVATPKLNGYSAGYISKVRTTKTKVSSRQFSSNKQNIHKDALLQRPEDTIFAKIVSKEIPAKIVYEDDVCLAFHDIGPVTPTHILVIPKKPMAGIPDSFEEAQIVGHCMIAARKVAEQEKLGNSGFRLVVNHGTDALQSVRWLHIHVLGGKKLSWPPGV